MFRRLGASFRWPWKLMQRLADWVDSDRPANLRPPGTNFIPNSGGSGGRVIASGHFG
jgi:hypothetical protein